MEKTDQESLYEKWYEKRQKYLDKYYLWLDKNEMRCEGEEEEGVDCAAFLATEDDLREWRETKRKVK